jgi:hypothetical protein
LIAAVALTVLGTPLLALDSTAAQNPARNAPAASIQPAQVNNALRGLDQLRRYGYTWTTDAGALRAVKAWQRANGLVVDGIIGPQTLASLGVTGATASAPATRLNPPAPADCDVECIIRDVWPDDLENEAVRIATRESRLVPTAANACCHGIFQIHFRAHRAWLGQFGVTQPSDLYDPRTNAIVALALYNEAGWSPWAL